MPEPLRRIPPADSASEVADGRPSVAVFIEAMSEEQVELLADDLVAILAECRTGRR